MFPTRTRYGLSGKTLRPLARRTADASAESAKVSLGPLQSPSNSLSTAIDDCLSLDLIFCLSTNDHGQTNLFSMTETHVVLVGVFLATIFANYLQSTPADVRRVLTAIGVTLAACLFFDRELLDAELGHLGFQFMKTLPLFLVVYGILLLRSEPAMPSPPIMANRSTATSPLSVAAAGTSTVTADDSFAEAAPIEPQPQMEPVLLLPTVIVGGGTSTTRKRRRSF